MCPGANTATEECNLQVFALSFVATHNNLRPGINGSLMNIISSC